MENKYYTPSIEEFYVGFEYEGREANSYEWNQLKFDAELDELESNPYINIEYLLQDDNLRVKYLDKEDIENLGFKYEKHYTFKKYINNKYNKTKTLIRIEYDWNNHSNVLIEFYNQNNFTNGMSFIIKNKSELKILLKQLGIDE